METKAETESVVGAGRGISWLACRVAIGQAFTRWEKETRRAKRQARQEKMATSRLVKTVEGIENLYGQAAVISAIESALRSVSESEIGGRASRPGPGGEIVSGRGQLAPGVTVRSLLDSCEPGDRPRSRVSG